MQLSEKEILKIVEIIEESGEVAKKAFLNKNFIVNYKQDESPVSNIDIELGIFITNALKQNFPQIKVICEEDDNSNNQINQSDHLFWLLDPIDGTSSFIGNSDEFAINLALVKNGKAIFGIIYAPLFMGGKMLFTNHLGLVVNKDKNNIHNLLPKLNSNYNRLNELRILVSTKTKNQQIEDLSKLINLPSDCENAGFLLGDNLLCHKFIVLIILSLWYVKYSLIISLNSE